MRKNIPDRDVVPKSHIPLGQDLYLLQKVASSHKLQFRG